MAAPPKQLGPPVVFRTMDRTKDPLPAIGSANNSPAHPASSGGTTPMSLASPASGDDSSPPAALSGSLALARRRNRATAAVAAASPDEATPAPSRNPAAMLDILDPDVDGSPTGVLALAGNTPERSPNRHLAPLDTPQHHPNPHAHAQPGPPPPGPAPALAPLRGVSPPLRSGSPPMNPPQPSG